MPQIDPAPSRTRTPRSAPVSQSLGAVAARRRFLVPDLSPEADESIATSRPRIIFVAESPHRNEIAPENAKLRRPLCGMAGGEWWKMLGQILEGKPLEDLSRVSLAQFCARHRIAVVNAVQWPLDPKITTFFADANPLELLGFSKAAGPESYKKPATRKRVDAALADLRKRLDQPGLAGVPVHCLGLDAEWFVRRALSDESSYSDVDEVSRIQARIPHPSAWWRRGGAFRVQAREQLSAIFSVRTKGKTGKRASTD